MARCELTWEEKNPISYLFKPSKVFAKLEKMAKDETYDLTNGGIYKPEVDENGIVINLVFDLEGIEKWLKTNFTRRRSVIVKRS